VLSFIKSSYISRSFQMHLMYQVHAISQVHAINVCCQEKSLENNPSLSSDFRLRFN
jgi:hypothetical protein